MRISRKALLSQQASAASNTDRPVVSTNRTPIWPIAGARWKVDIWNTPQVAPASLEYNAWIEQSLTRETREIILMIKKANILHNWNLPGPTIYNAVLTGKVKTIEEFQRGFMKQPLSAAS